MVTLHLPHIAKLTDEVFEDFVRANPELGFETTAMGELVIVPPTGGTSGRRNMSLSEQLSAWSRSDGTGVAFDSSTVFLLPNGARRSPDASWVAIARWNALTRQQQDGYPPLCPDFVVELMSPSDAVTELQAKMREYMDNGARLGWLINPIDVQTEIYRQGQNVEILDNPTAIFGEEVLPGLVLNFSQIFS